MQNSISSLNTVIKWTLLKKDGDLYEIATEMFLTNSTGELVGKKRTKQNIELWGQRH